MNDGDGGPPAPVEVASLPVPLGAFLKLSGTVRSGGEAKAACLAERVRVNGEVETRRGRSLSAGDLVQVDTGTVRVVLPCRDSAP